MTKKEIVKEKLKNHNCYTCKYIVRMSSLDSYTGKVKKDYFVCGVEGNKLDENLICEKYIEKLKTITYKEFMHDK